MRGFFYRFCKHLSFASVSFIGATVLFMPWCHVSCKKTIIPSIITGDITVNNRPMEGVVVVLTHPRFGMVSTVTDADGVFTFTNVWGGTCTVTPQLEGYTFSPRSVVIDSRVGFVQPIHFHTVVTWARVFRASYDNGAYAVKQTADGGYIVAGYTYVDEKRNYDAFLKKLDMYGNEEWMRTYGGPLYDMAYSVEQTADGGYIVAGVQETQETSDDSGRIISGQISVWKTNAAGEVQWEVVEGGIEWDVARCVRVTSDGGYIVAGYSDSGELSNVRVLKIRSDGVVEWDRTYDGSHNFDRSYAIVQTKDGAYIVAGTTEFFGTDESQAWILKLRNDGNDEWMNWYSYPGVERNEWRDIVVGGSGEEWVAAGYFEGGEFGYSDTWIMGVDDDGTRLWSGTAGTSLYHKSYALDGAGASGYILAGYRWNNNEKSKDIALVRMDADGGLMWEKAFSGEAGNSDEAYAVQAASDGGFVLAGKSRSLDGGDDVVVIKTDEYGDVSGIRDGIR